MSTRARIARVSFTTADPERIAAFYCGALGFERVATYRRSGRPFSELMADGGDVEAIVLRLGREEIALFAFAERGRPYPPERASNDPWFQHIAIVVSDMDAAYARLVAHDDWSPISHDGPQRLPADSGGVTAFKFRDPEGHPLELLAFPKDAAPLVWRRSDAVFLGIDHSAICVANTRRSLRFYERLLGFSIRIRTLNRGPEQDNLDGLGGAVVEVTGLHMAGAPRPNLELLRYRAPVGAPPLSLRSNDIATTRLEVEVPDPVALIADLRKMGTAFVSPGGAALDDGQMAALVRDPDGHHILFRTTS